MTAPLLTVLLLVIVLAIFFGAQLRKTNQKLTNPNFIKVDLMTIAFNEEGEPIQTENGGYEMILLKKDFVLKVPVPINSEDSHIKPPFWEHDNKLWLYHSIVQLKDRINLIVMFAGSVDPEKSPFCANAAKMKVVK
jgi:hypothetical protein